MEVSFLYRNNVKSNLSITLYAILIDGEIKILTGAKDTGESLLTFEGYVSPEEYFNSLTITERLEENYSSWTYINGVYTELPYYNVLLTEPTVNGVTVTKSIRLSKAPNGEYLTYSHYIGDILTVIEEYPTTNINPNHTLDKTYKRIYCNGTFTFAEFSYVNVYKYYAIKIGDYFYDLDDFYNHGGGIGEDEFQHNMYDTQRYYKVWDDDMQDWRYYDKFIPGEYFEVYEEVYPEYLPADCNETVLGYTKEGKEVIEIWFYVDESNPDNEDMTVITLSDGSLFYHINGQGYIKLGENEYIRAVIITDDEGNTSALCIIRRAYVIENEIGVMFEKYLSYNGSNRVVIPRELIEIMASANGECYFVIETDQGSIHFDYYSLAEAFGIAGGFDEKPEGDFGGDYNGDKYDDQYKENGEY